MHLYCPACGRLTPYNPGLTGLTIKICHCCIFSLEQSRQPAKNAPDSPPVQGRLRLHGFTLVRN